MLFSTVFLCQFLRKAITSQAKLMTQKLYNIAMFTCNSDIPGTTVPVVIQVLENLKVSTSNSFIHHGRDSRIEIPIKELNHF